MRPAHRFSAYGMVGGRIFSRGSHKGFSQNDAKLIPISDEDWKWLVQNLKIYLEHIHKTEILEDLSDREQWQLLTARTPQERLSRQTRSMASFGSGQGKNDSFPGFS